MNIEKQVSLKHLNTFGIDVKADFMAAFNTAEQLVYFLTLPEFKSIPNLVLGGGSNILFTKDFNGIVLKNDIQGIEVTGETDSSWFVTCGGGVVWHELVIFCIDRNFGGIENLSLIPGKAGAAPIQNIGAYGVELKDTFHKLEAIDLVTGEKIIFEKNDCSFGYRDSVFKRHLKGKFVITSITLRLNKVPELNISYGAISQELKKAGIEKPTVKNISDVVCAIRRSKLPDPAQIGNAGSFFKNPEVSGIDFLRLRQNYDGIVGYELPGGNFKLAAGWLIEQCGWKGKRVGNTGSHKDQALVLVNYGDATGSEILDLAINIQVSVLEKFGVTIEPEVNIM